MLCPPPPLPRPPARRLCLLPCLLQDFKNPGSQSKQYFLGLEQVFGGSGNPAYPGGQFFNLFNLGKTPEAMKKLQTNEIRNGRLAMIATLGMAAQAVMTQKGPWENLQAHLVSGWVCGWGGGAQAGWQAGSRVATQSACAMAAPQALVCIETEAPVSHLSPPALSSPLPHPPAQADPTANNLLGNLGTILKA